MPPIFFVTVSAYPKPLHGMYFVNWCQKKLEQNWITFGFLYSYIEIEMKSKSMCPGVIVLAMEIAQFCSMSLIWIFGICSKISSRWFSAKLLHLHC